ncbi:MAG: Phage major capsid protein [Rhodospirillaceae bacterium]|nr:MAG: Phage major capsid protein [Rhodospirillaceae bacterium]
MSDRLKALREKRGQAVSDMRAITEAAEKEKRDLSAEELDKHGTIFKTVDGLRQQIEAEERTIEATRQAAADELRDNDSGRKPGGEGEETPEKRQMKAFRRFLTGGTAAVGNGDGAEELRALQAGSSAEGGYLVAPQEFVTNLIKNVDNATFIRARANKFTVTKAESLGAPTLENDAADSDWTVELGTGSEDTGMRFGKRELKPHPLAKRIKVSKKLIRISALPIDGIIQARMGYKIGITQEKAFLIGDGQNKPLGVFTASADGISTGRDVSTGNTTTAIAFDGLIEAKFSVKAAYWPKADWLFHRDAVKNITKLKDGDGQYLWRMSVRDGEPDTLLGRPLMVSEYVPNTFTTGQYVGMFGDFSNYWIVDALDMQIQRLTELYAETNQDGFIGRMESDGMPVLEEAFARVKLA